MRDGGFPRATTRCDLRAADPRQVRAQRAKESAYMVERVTRIELALSAWEVSSAIRGLRAETLICGILARLATSDREMPLGLTRSGT